MSSGTRASVDATIVPCHGLTAPGAGPASNDAWLRASIAERTGFGSAASLRHHFRRVADVSPAGDRRAFGRSGR